MEKQTSWGRVNHANPKTYTPNWDIKLPASKPMLAFGLGRSYGDVCLTNKGTSIVMNRQNRLILRNDITLRAEAGLSLGDVLKFALPLGLFLPVSPGTKHVTLGGAIANDVHGKNHHVAGSFGCHVKKFELLRSSGEKLICSREQNSEMFYATVGGLGLTGLITWVELELKKASSLFNVETIRFKSLNEFFSINEESDRNFDYTVAWLDATRPGLGVYMRGNHAEAPGRYIQKNTLDIPFDFPNITLNQLSISAFNKLYYLKNKNSKIQQNYESFFYPLDGIGHWNRIYGKRGFYQHQCVIPFEKKEILADILNVSKKEASFLAVLKAFGPKESGGLLSFPKPGYTLALDFANNGATTLKILEKLETIVVENGGRIYLAKDAVMAQNSFEKSYGNITKFKELIDPEFSSIMSQRLGLTR